MLLPVNEIFETIQGEAHWTGTPSVFVRFQFCDVGCPWCDTKHTWELKRGDQVDIEQVLAKLGDGPQFAYVTVDALATYVCSLKSSHVVMTGGEPCAYDLSEFARILQNRGKTVQVETSGTYPIIVGRDTWVTLSPKFNMPGGRIVLADSIAYADEIKMPVGKPKDIERLQELLNLTLKEQVEVWLQPLSQSKKATELCIQAARDYGWKLSCQVHKYIGVR